MNALAQSCTGNKQDFYYISKCFMTCVKLLQASQTAEQKYCAIGQFKFVPFVPFQHSGSTSLAEQKMLFAYFMHYLIQTVQLFHDYGK